MEKATPETHPVLLESKQPSGGDAEQARSSVLESSQDVTWENEDDPANPYNWPQSRKLTMTVLLSLGGLVSLMSTSMIAPALGDISQDFHTRDSETNLILSIYILALAFGPLIISPLSEMFGRKWVYLGCHVWYICWNAVAPVGKIKALLIVGRFSSGLGASVALALPGSMMADMWRSDKRGMSYAIVTFAPLLGVAVGPIVGGFVTDSLGWPWLFWIISMWDALLVFLGIFLIHECYEPTLLAEKAKKLRKTTGQEHFTEIERTHPTLGKKLKFTMIRPVRILVTQPIVPIISIYMAYHFGVYCLAISTFADVWTSTYDQSISISGLHYIAIAMGAAFASPLGGLATDKIWAHLKAKAGGSVTPEYRIPLMIPGALISPIGILWYGWSVEKRLMWLMPDIGVCIFNFGNTLSQQAVINYVVEIFGQQSASAVAAVRVLSNLFGFTFPLFAAQLYVSLGYGWGNSLLAFLFLAMGIPAPILLWKFGARIRAAGKGRV